MKHRKAAKGWPKDMPMIVLAVVMFFSCLFFLWPKAWGDDRAGDANGDGACNVGDAVYTINYVFKGGPPPVPLQYATADQVGSLERKIDDLLRINASMAVTWPVPGAYEVVRIDDSGVIYLYKLGADSMEVDS